MHGDIRRDTSHYGMEYTNPYIPWGQIFREMDEREAAKKKNDDGEEAVTPTSLTNEEKGE